MKINYVLIFGLLLTLKSLGQQDDHASYWYKSPTLVNTGAPIIGYGKFSAFTAMRMQWFAVNGSPMRTNTFSFLAKIGEQIRDGYFTAGVNFHNDQTGNGSILTNSVSVPVNYTIRMRNDRFLSLGLSPGVMMRVISNRGTWGNQWTGTSFDQGIANGEGFTQMKSTFFDMNTGLFYQQFSGSGNLFLLGASVNHVIQPKYTPGSTFRTDEVKKQYGLQMSYLAHGKTRLFSYRPAMMASYQGGNYNILGGVEIIYHAKERSRSLIYEEGIDFNFGVFYRYLDALIGQFSYRNGGFEAGLSYDMTLSRLTRATKSVGALEVFLRFNFAKNNHSFDFRK